MHAFLITGGSQEQRNTYLQKLLVQWRVAPFDQVKLEAVGPSIGIAQIRALEKQLWLTPYASPYIVGIIAAAQLLTLEAQQALLKTLEEPPRQARLILETATPEMLTATIISRCQLINLGSPPEKLNDDGNQIRKTFPKILSGSQGQRLQISETLALDREAALTWVEQAIAQLREMLLAAYSLSSAKIQSQFKLAPLKVTSLLRGLLLARRRLLANVNPRLVLDQFFLQNC